MNLAIPLLNIKSLLESKPRNSRFLVRGLAVREQGHGATGPLTSFVQMQIHVTYIILNNNISLSLSASNMQLLPTCFPPGKASLYVCIYIYIYIYMYPIEK